MCKQAIFTMSYDYSHQAEAEPGGGHKLISQMAAKW